MRAHEGADEFVADLWCDGVGIDACGFQEFFGVVDAVDARRFNVDGFEACGGEFLLVFRVCQRACDASDPKLHALANLVRDFASNDYVGDRETAAGLEYAECFAQNTVLVARWGCRNLARRAGRLPGRSRLRLHHKGSR